MLRWKIGLTVLACVLVIQFSAYRVAGADEFPTNQELAERNIALEMVRLEFESGLKHGPDGKPNGDGLGLSLVTVRGSGFIVGEDGTIVTNYHVARRAVKGQAIFKDGARYEIKNLKVFNRSSDLALLKISAEKKFPVCSFGDSDKVEPRDKVLAVGNPMGTGLNITEGIVSQATRDDNGKVNSITHTATVTSGNSGGALYSKDGVIGVNVAIQVNPKVGGGTGFNYAIPINKAKGLLKYDKLKSLESVFPPDIEKLTKKAKKIKQSKGSCPGSQGEKPGIWKTNIKLTKLTDYMISVESPGKRLAVIALNSKGDPIGYGNKNQVGSQGLLIGAENSGAYIIGIQNNDPKPVNFVVNIYQIKW